MPPGTVAAGRGGFLVYRAGRLLAPLLLQAHTLSIMNNFRGRISATAVVFFLLAAANLHAAEPLSRSKYVFWTQCTVTLHDHQDPGILDEVFKRLDELQRPAQRERARQRA